MSRLSTERRRARQQKQRRRWKDPTNGNAPQGTDLRGVEAETTEAYCMKPSRRALQGRPA